MSDKKAKSKAKKGEIKLDAASLKQAAVSVGAAINRYGAVLFLILVAGVYGFVVLRVNILSNAQPSQSDISAQAGSTVTPRIDPQVADQLQQLEDNSVNVQTLFNDARNNPFQ